jgi:hypothetical protein
MLSLAEVRRLQEYGIDSLHVLVVPVPVAATVLDSIMERGAPPVKLSCTKLSALQEMTVSVVVLRVTVIVTVIVPVNSVAAGASTTASSDTAGTARNAPVCGSRYPRIPGLEALFAA